MSSSDYTVQTLEVKLKVSEFGQFVQLKQMRANLFVHLTKMRNNLFVYFYICFLYKKCMFFLGELRQLLNIIVLSLCIVCS